MQTPSRHFLGEPKPGAPGHPPPLGPKRLASWERSKGMWDDGPGAGGPAPPRLTYKAPLWGLNRVPRPPPLELRVPQWRGQGQTEAEGAGRPPSSQPRLCRPPPPALGPAARPPHPRPLFAVPQSCSCSQAAGAGRVSPPPGLCPPTSLSTPISSAPRGNILDIGRPAASATYSPKHTVLPAVRGGGRAQPGCGWEYRLPDHSQGPGTSLPVPQSVE